MLLEEGLWRRHFPVRVGFVEFMGLPLFIEHLGATASVTKNTGVTNKQHTITADLVDLTKPYIEKEYLKAFHLNISSLPFDCSELHRLLNNYRINFDIIRITESRLKRSQRALQNIDILNYNIEHCPTESTNGGPLIYVKNDMIYKVRNNLKIYQSEKLESVFIKIIKSNNRNIIVGCVYRHPSMEVNEFNSLFLNNLSKNLISEKNKKIVLLGDFNIDLLKYKKDHNTSDFLAQINSASLVPHITFPTRMI